MAFQPLTKEQFEKARKAGFTPEKIVEMEQRRKAESGGVSQGTSSTDVSRETVKDGLLKSIVKDPIETLVVKPATRFGQVLGVPIAKALGASDEGIDRALNTDTEVNLGPFGKYNVEAVKPGKEGAKQIAGEGLHAASYLVGGSGEATALARPTLGTAIRAGAKVGAESGAMFGAGEALEQGGGTKEALLGAGTGALFGGAFGAAIPPAIALPKAAYNAGRELVSPAVDKIRGGFASRAATKAAQEAEQLALLERGATDARVATKRLEPAPVAPTAPNAATLPDGAPVPPETPKMRVVDDPAAQEAVRQGIPESEVALIKGASDADKVKMNKMINIRESQLRDKSILERGTDVSGKTALDQFRYVEKVNRDTAKQLDDVAKRLAGQKSNPTEALVKFGEDLDNAGILVKKNGALEFKGSDFEGLKPVQKSIVDVWNRAMRVAKTGDALQLHRLKSYIDNIVEYGAEGTGLSGRAEKLLKTFRHNVDLVLDTQFPQYNQVNTVFAETIRELNKLGEVMGRRFRLSDDFADAAMGTKLRGILSNRTDRGKILQTLQSVQEVAKKYGMKIDEDVVKQVQFADTLEELFGSEAPTSFLGQGERFLQNAQDAVGTVSDIASNPLRGGIKAVTKVIQATRGINQENKIKALREILKVIQKEEPKAPSVFGKPRPAVDKPVAPMASRRYTEPVKKTAQKKSSIGRTPKAPKEGIDYSINWDSKKKVWYASQIGTGERLFANKERGTVEGWINANGKYVKAGVFNPNKK